MKEVTVLLPAYKEEEAIGRVIDEIREVLPTARILVAYQPSPDGTERILEEKGVDWITENKRGKGYAVRAAIQSISTPYVVMLNSDYTYPAKHIPVLLEHLEDVALGYRYKREPRSMTRLNFLGNTMLSLMASILYGRRVRDVCTGLWAFRKGVLDKFELESGGFTLEADLFVNCVRNQCRIYQMPIDYRRRVDGVLPKLRIVDGFHIGMFLVKKRLNRVEQFGFALCPGVRCKHYANAVKYQRKCYYEPQCWRGKISNWVKSLRKRRYRKDA